MWKSLFLPDTKPFCLWITLCITKAVINIIHKYEICRKIKLEKSLFRTDLSTGYQQVIHRFWGTYSQFNSFCVFNLPLIFL